MPRIYRPRMLLRLTVPLPKGDDYEAFTFEVPVVSAHHTKNDHNHADTLSTTLDWIDTGVDPRWIAGATCEFYLGNADDFGEWQPGPDNLRFVGRLVKPSRDTREQSLEVQLEFHDYTSFFLLAKPFATDGTPLYSESLTDAWARICKHTPGAEALASQIEYRGLSGIPKIGDAVAPRFRKAGKVHVQPGMDAWAVWKQCTGSLGLISFIELDKCIVTPVEDYYTAGDPPRIVWGKNLLTLHEERNNDRGSRGVGLTSFDPITGKTIEAIYNPNAALKAKPKRVPAKKANSKSSNAQLDELKELDFFVYPAVTDQATLDRVCRAVYEERSRSDLEGHVSTGDMTAETIGGDEFDLLGLASGDVIEIRLLDSDDAAFVRDFKSEEARVDYLVNQKKYTPEAAKIIAANVDRLTPKSNQFYVKSVSTSLTSEADGGSFRVEIDFMNKIDPSGGAADPSKQ